MSRGASPLHFLGLVLGGWLCGRLFFLAPDWLTETAVAERARPQGGVTVAQFRRVARPVLFLPLAQTGDRGRPIEMSLTDLAAPVRPANRSRHLAAPTSTAFITDERSPPPLQAPPASSPSSEISTLPGPPLLRRSEAASPILKRWTLSTWAFVRQGEGGQLATGGTLGGSQIGARATYAIGQRIAASARLYAPLNRPDGAEAAIGVEVQPIQALPIRVLAERRQSIGGNGRSAFAMLAYGGIDETRLIGPVRIDAYAQAGVVGLKSRDGFVDGAVRLGVPIGDRTSVGVGAWGAVQPGVSRVDLGPQASYRLRVLGGSARVDAQWRFRVAGDARPGSGPALTLSTDF